MKIGQVTTHNKHNLICNRCFSYKMCIIQNTDELSQTTKAKYMQGENNEARCLTIIPVGAYVKLAAGKQIPHYAEQDLIFCYEFRVLFLLIRQG